MANVRAMLRLAVVAHTTESSAESLATTLSVAPSSFDSIVERDENGIVVSLVGVGTGGSQAIGLQGMTSAFAVKIKNLSNAGVIEATLEADGGSPGVRSSWVLPVLPNGAAVVASSTAGFQNPTLSIVGDSGTDFSVLVAGDSNAD